MQPSAGIVAGYGAFPTQHRQPQATARSCAVGKCIELLAPSISLA